MSALFSCPFCGYKASAEYGILFHIEVHHNEGESPFVADEDRMERRIESMADKDEPSDYLECPVKRCGEILSLASLEDHLDLHRAEKAENSAEGSHTSDPDETTSESDSSTRPTRAASSGPSSATPKGSAGRAAGAALNWKHLLNKPSRKPGEPPLTGPGGLEFKTVKRLGKKELGTYHNEERMPDWLADLLKRRGYKSSKGVIPVLAQLLQRNRHTQYAYLCHPVTQHISKLRREGSFCGYRNIQMMISYIIGAGAPGAAAFGETIPSIFQIQDLIEHAWDEGIHEEGRIELGGIRGTRKYIGTPEAQTLLASLGIPWDMQTFKNGEGDPPSASENRVYDAVEEYFATAPDVSPRGKVRNTTRPPIYFQHQGHSMTIIGIERQLSGNRNLLVFDPSYGDPSSVTRHIGSAKGADHSSGSADRTLKLYRRGPRYLSKYRAFELLRLRQ